MALPFVVGLVIGSGAALLFAKKDMVKQGLDLAKGIIKEKEEVVAPKRRKRRTKAEIIEAEQNLKTKRKRRTRKSPVAKVSETRETQEIQE